ncbi:hypothetical protein AGMMS50289_26560 [Betaproteobacteria bacterium]|nr:hypothetical protein AGMMS50289_26560 [Betaproteobacteria bacterium]
MNLYQYAPNAWNWIDPWGWNCSGHAKNLNKTMAKEGRVVKSGQAAGHIVASGAKKAAASRSILNKYKIGTDHAANGIPVEHPRPHSGMHKNTYHQQVHDRLQKVVSKGQGWGKTRKELVAELRKIGQETSAGVFP